MKKKIFAAVIILAIIGFIANMHSKVSEIGNAEIAEIFRRADHLAVVSVGEVKIKSYVYCHAKVHEVLMGELSDEVVFHVPENRYDDLAVEGDTKYLMFFNDGSPADLGMYSEAKQHIVTQNGIYTVDEKGKLTPTDDYATEIAYYMTDIETVRKYLTEMQTGG